MRTFFDTHPLLRILAIDTVLTAVALGLGYFLVHKYSFDASTVLFVEALAFLMVAVSAVTGNSTLRKYDVVYAKDNGHQSYIEAYAFAITVGLPGVILFFLSGIGPVL